MAWRISIADVEVWARQYSGEKFHALLCDPPYNLESIQKRFGKNGSAPAKHGKDVAFGRVSSGFLGEKWDTDVAFRPEVWEAIGEHLYPGAFGLAFSSTRTYHRLATAIEDAGFIIHPMFGWIQSQGFCKATKIDNQIDKMAGQEQEVIGWPTVERTSTKPRIAMRDGWGEYAPVTIPSTDLAKAWQGHRYGLQAIAPTMEPICLFQKPYQGKPVENMVETGAGALNIEGTRYGDNKITINRFDSGMKPFGNAVGEEYETVLSDGYWPKNIITEDGLHGDDEQHSKFFLQLKNYKYHKKASKSEKEAGLDDLIPVPFAQSGGAMSAIERGETEYSKTEGLGLGDIKLRRNFHPTCKPIGLIEYLARLLLPPDMYAPRRILVPFSGVSSELIGCLLAGWEIAHGVEMSDEYAEIGAKRLEHWLN